MTFGGAWGGGRVSAGTGGGSSDTTPPVIADYNPPLGTPIARTGTIQFTATDAGSGIKRVIIVAAYAATGVDELVFDGDNFRGAYAGRSRVEIIPSGYRFSIGRGAGGFLSQPSFTAFAVDKAGNENV